MTTADRENTGATPFDDVIESILTTRYHNHRRQEHSNLVSDGVFRDLKNQCPQIASDCQMMRVAARYNVPAPGARGRRVDLFVGESGQDGSLQPNGARVCVENKSVITAHRNKTNRLDDLDEVMRGIHRVKPECVLVATVLIGTAQSVLNVPDHVKKLYKNKSGHFDSKIRPRLSTGDQSLWAEFEFAISKNRAVDPQKTIDAFRGIPTRPPGHTHALGYDFMLLIPVFVDNVNPPRIDRDNQFGIDVDEDYQKMLDTICQAYATRWHL